MSRANLRTIARAATLVMIFFIISRVLGIVRDAVIASHFGTGREYEAYLAAFVIPDFVFYVISGGALGSAFIPTFTGYLARGDNPGAWRLASAVLNWLLLVLILLGGLMVIFAPVLVQLVVPGFSATDKALTANLMRWLLISTVIFGISGLMMGILHAHQHFLLPAVAPVIYNIAIIAGALFLAPWLGVYGLVVGVVVGALGHLLVQVPGLRHFRIRYEPVLMPRDPGLRQVARLMGPRMFGLAAIQFSFIWDKVLSSGLPAGALSGLDYGRRIMLLPQGIIGQAVAAAAFPTFSALVAEEAWDDLQQAFTSTLRGMLYLAVPATIGLMMLGRPLIQIIFQRNNFDAESTQFTYWALIFYSLGLVGHSLVEILTRAFYALHNTKTPVLIGIIAMGINIGLSWLLMGLFAQLKLAPHGGIALAGSVAVTVELVWLIVALRHLPGSLSVAGLTRVLGQILLAGGVMALSLWALLALIGAGSPWLVAPAGMAVGGLVYGGVSIWLGVEEPRLIWRQVRRRLPF